MMGALKVWSSTSKRLLLIKIPFDILNKVLNYGYCFSCSIDYIVQI